MRAILLKIVPHPSRDGRGDFWYCFWKGEDGKSYISSISKFDPDTFRPMRNFSKWQAVINSNPIGKTFYDLQTRKSSTGRWIVDADSDFKIEGKELLASPKNEDVPETTNTGRPSPNFDKARKHIQEALKLLEVKCPPIS